MGSWSSLLDGVNNYSLYIGGDSNAIADMVASGFLPFWYIRALEYLGEFFYFVMMAFLSSGLLIVGFFAFWWWVTVPALRFISRNYR